MAKQDKTYLKILRRSGAEVLAKQLDSNKADVKGVVAWLTERYDDDFNQLLDLHQCLKLPVTSTHLQLCQKAQSTTCERKVAKKWGKGWKMAFRFGNKLMGTKKLIAVRDLAAVYKLSRANRAVDRQRMINIANSKSGEYLTHTTSDYKNALLAKC